MASLAPFAAVFFAQPAPPSWKLVIGGATKGYLSPCGCTSPMSGGIRRRATVVKQIAGPGDVVLETGPMTGELGRQMEIKAETLAQAFKDMGVAAVTLGKGDAGLGPGVLEAVSRLSGAQLIDGGPEPVSHCLIGSDAGEIAIAEAIRRAKQLATEPGRGLARVYVTGLAKEEAREIARAVPQLDAIVFATSSNPRGQAERIGKTWIVTAADEGRFVVSLPFTGAGFEAPTVYDLGPDIKDDPETARYYHQYLDRLRGENLVEMMPKTSNEPFSGSKACKSCHQAEYEVWEKSKHAHAWPTLKQDGHDADPDCVPCHTTGIQSTGGFLIEEKTPHLAEVGCESCHGSGAAHITMPEANPFPKAGEKSCAGCHKLQNSPNFRFKAYWEKIKH